MKMTSFFSIDKYFFFIFLKDQKLFLKGTKKNFFHQKSEGILHLLFAGIACKIYFLMPSNFDEKLPLDYDKFCPLKMMAFIIFKGNIICWHFLKALPSADNFHCILRAITVYFWDEVFSLRIWGHFIQQCRGGTYMVKCQKMQTQFVKAPLTVWPKTGPPAPPSPPLATALNLYLNI